MPFGRRRAGQGNEVSLLRAVALPVVEALAAAVGAEGCRQALLDKAPPQALDGRDPGIESLRDALVAPGTSAFGGIGLEQDLGMLELAYVRLAAGQQLPKVLALSRGQRHTVLLVHLGPPCLDLVAKTRTPKPSLQP